MKRLQSFLNGTAESILESYGFRRLRALKFVREHKGHTADVRLFAEPPGEAGKPPSWCFGVGIEYPALTTLINLGDPDRYPQKFGCIVTLLRKPPRFVYFLFEDPDAEETASNRLQHELITYALPFFDRYTTMRQIQDDLLDKKAPFAMDRGSRVTAIGGIFFLHGDVDSAIMALQEGLELPMLTGTEHENIRRLLEHIKNYPRPASANHRDQGTAG